MDGREAVWSVCLMNVTIPFWRTLDMDMGMGTDMEKLGAPGQSTALNIMD